MTAFLASVSTVAEADRALRAGVDMLDLKEPGTGALGALPVWRWRQIAPRYRHRALISVTLGDPPYASERLRRLAALAAQAGAHIVKIGLRADMDRPAVAKTVASLARLRVGLALVFLVEEDEPDLSGLSPGRHISAVMLDTVDKSAGGLTQKLSLESIGRFVAVARRHRLPVGLSGSLKKEDIRPLLSLNPDYLGFRSALCRQGERASALDLSSVRRIRSLISKHGARYHGPDHAFFVRTCQRGLNIRHWNEESQPDSRRPFLRGGWRKVRAPQGKVPDNVWEA